MASCLVYIALLTIIGHGIGAEWRPCVELKRDLRVPCRCIVSPKYPRALEMNCDRVIFTKESLEGLRGQPIVAISQQSCGYQNLPSDLIESVPSTLEKLDLSGNSIHRLMDRLLQGRMRLRELRLADNLLGDNLNPIFSSNEFHEMAGLRLLDLSGNGLRSIEEGIFKGCTNLEELHLDRNNLTALPIGSLKGPKAIRVLSLAGNNIGSIQRGAFSTLGESLVRVDLSDNELSHMDDGAMAGMESLLILNVSRNHLQRFNSDVFRGAYKLQQLDLSANFLHEFPADALRHLEELKFLNASNNLITELERTQLSGLTDLQVLDLSRNGLGRLGVNAFSALKSLVKLDLSFNALRAIEESSFEGLANLKWLSLQDNNILLVPATALARLPALSHLHLEFNRVAALASDLIRSSAPRLVTLSLTRNLVRELPPRLFFTFDRLLSIELSGNMLTTIGQQTFAGLEDTLLHMDLSNNRLMSIAELPLASLVSLNLAGNMLKRIPPDTFRHLDRLQYLNISDNPLYGGFPPIFPRTLISLDVARTGLKILPTVLLLNLESLESVSFSGNRLRELGEATFQHLSNLSSIDLSYNEISKIENGAFIGLPNLYKLNLRGNMLTGFAGEHFNTGTGLELLDLSSNYIDHLSPTTFLIHPRLREINLSNNQFIVFPGEFAKNLQFLEHLDLSGNKMHSIGEFAFAQLGRLRVLDLSSNEIESVDELAFHNSTQLQQLDLSNNSLDTLSDRTMEGMLRLEILKLNDNHLSSLPETIFDASRIRSVERIDLSGNRFAEIPTRTLHRQSSNLIGLNFARNRMTEVFTQDIINSVKDLDLSENPLTENAVRGILGEAKVLRSLNLALCGVRRISRLEAPFLQKLNLSKNYIDDIGPAALERTTMLEYLDISHNRLTEFASVLGGFGSMASLRYLDVSGNDVKVINETTFEGFESLHILKMSSLMNCTKIEKNSFKPLSALRVLRAFDYPVLGYFDIQGILRGLNNIQKLEIEVKDLNIGIDQLSLRTHPRLHELTLRGERLRNILTSALTGIRTPSFYIGLKNTSIETIPSTLFFPVPRSTQLELDVTGSKFNAITPTLVSALEERSGAVKLKGTDIKVRCDCEAKQLWRWARSPSARLENPIICNYPNYVAGRALIDLSEDKLSCEPAKTTTQSRPQSMETATSTRHSTSSEPVIIWTPLPTLEETRNKHHNNEVPMNVSTAGSGTDDTLIIGIVGGVVAFIAIVIIVICICRLRWSSQVNEARMQAAMASSIHEASMIRPPSAYSGKANQEIYVGSYNGSTLGHANHHNTSMTTSPVQMMPFVQPVQMVHQMQGHPQPIYGYYDNSAVPVYLTCPSENKFDR